jgi:hypothetical protein
MYLDPELGQVMSYDEWGGLSRHVRKGQKAHWVKIGTKTVPVFTEDQTSPNLPRKGGNDQGEYKFGEHDDELLGLSFGLDIY